MSNLLVQNIKHTNGTTAQTIDSTGRVTNPNCPAWSVYFYNDGTGSSDGSGGDGVGAGSGSAVTILWNRKSVDTGNSYNTSTGQYTVPVSGVYFVSLKLLGASDSGGNAQTLNMQLQKSTDSGTNFSGIDIHYCQADGSSGYPNASSTTIHSFNAGDILRTQVMSGYMYIEASDNPYCRWSGHLIG